MILTQHAGRSSGVGPFEIKCATCNRVYVQFVVEKTGAMNYEFPMPLTPCHADGFNVSPKEEDPWETILCAFGLSEKRDGKFEGGTFQYSVTMVDGMIYRVSVARVE